MHTPGEYLVTLHVPIDSDLISNETLGLLLDHIGGAIAFVPLVRLGVDERTLDYEFLFVFLI